MPILLSSLLLILALFLAGPAAAQGGPWGSYYNRSPYYDPPPRYYYPPRRYDSFSYYGWSDYDPFPSAPRFQSGGPRPAVAPLTPHKISFPNTYPVDSIVIDHRGRQLFLVISDKEAYRYPISVGKEGFSWTGSEPISRITEWPDWHPPEEMRDRDPSLPEKMSGGIRNPLGAKALYLGKTLYRIHGTNDARSIGKAASSGCFRMLNGHVVDLASRVKIGTVVTVVHQLPPELDRAVSQQVALLPEPRDSQPAQVRSRGTPRTGQQVRRRPPPPWYAYDPFWDDD